MAMLAYQILKGSTKLCSAKALLPSFSTLKFSARSGGWMSKQLQMAFMNSHSLDEDLPKDYNIFSWMPTPRDCLKDLENAAELTEKWDKVMEEAKKLGKEGKSEPCAYGHLYKFLMSEEMKIARNKLPGIIYEEMWNFARAQAEKKAFEGGSPFCVTMWGDHAFVRNPFSDAKIKWLETYLRRRTDINGDRASIGNSYCTVKNKMLETYLRCRKDIKFYTKFDSILSDRSMEDFQSSMTADEFQNCVMRHLYALTLEVLIPEEKRYMEHLINEFNYWEHYMEWHSQDYPTLLEPYESLFDKLPYSCLVRGLQLHISRIPYKYTKESLPEVLKKDMLRKLKKDYKLLIEKINYMQFLNIPQATMVREINTLVRHYAANPGCSHISLDHDASSTRCEYEVGSYQVPYVGLSTF